MLRQQTSRHTTVVLVMLVALFAGACESDGDDAKKDGAFGRLGADASDFGGPEGYKPTGQLVADLGYRPETHGFAFENYGGGDFKNLTPAEMQRLFGDQVCSNMTGPGGTCDLTPPAQEWMGETNKAMDGGHCYGLSVASLMFFKNDANPGQFGGDGAPRLPLQGNEALQRLIAYGWAFQALDGVRAGEIKGSPNEVLDKVAEGLKAASGGGRETYTLGIYKRDGSGGHAITPYAVEDKGDGRFAILVYDNNWPNITRAILVDRNANTWAYVASTKPDEPADEYQGDATSQTLSMLPTTPGLSPQPCPFCGGDGRQSRGSLGTTSLISTQAPRYNEIYLDGDPDNHAHLLITDEQGRRYGYAGDTFVTEIPGVRSRRDFLDDNWKTLDEPTYSVPVGIKFSVTIDGSSLKSADSTDVTMVGPGYDLAVNDINLEPGQKDTLTFAADAKTLTYQTTSSESPYFELGVDGPDEDYALALESLDMEGGGTLTLGLGQEGELIIDTTGLKSAGTFDLTIEREGERSDDEFEHSGVSLDPGEKASLDYDDFDSEGESLELETERNGVSDTEMITDVEEPDGEGPDAEPEEEE